LSRRSLAIALGALVTGGALLARSARAADPPKGDAVVLADGARVEGRVVEHVEGRFVTIETPDGRRRTFPWSAVREIDRAPAAALDGEPRVFRGGVTFGYALSAGLVAAWTEASPYALGGTCTAPSAGPTSVDRYGLATTARASGVGGGLEARATIAWRAPPRPTDRAHFWEIFASPGLGVAALRLRAPAGIAPATGEPCQTVEASPHDVTMETRASTLVTVPLALGARFGLGTFRDEATWRGVAVGLAWSPALAVLDGQSSFAPLGAELTVDVATLHARPRRFLPADAHVRTSAAVRAPAGGGPGVVTLGVGVAFY
jgi:hypothetical protein